MSATNHTTNYNLPQFVGSDKPTWLGDVNNAMLAIDNAVKAVADLVAGNTTDIGAVETSVSNMQTTVTGLQTTVSGHTTTIGGHTTAIGNAETDIDNLQAKVGTGNLSTLATTLIGGVNELDAKMKQNTNGQFKLANGLKIFWGSVATANVNGYVRSVAVTFPEAFSGEPMVTMGHLCGNTSLDTQVTYGFDNKTTTGVSLKLMHSGGSIASYDQPWVNYIAIGY